MRLIVGLGNYGSRYENTYHNVGFLTVDKLSEKFGCEFSKKECRALSASFFLNGEKIVLAKPQTFMNLSGESVRDFIQKYKFDLSEILIVYDDIDLELGKIRYRERGSGGTHNGMRNIISCLKTEDFARLRIGIGKPKKPNMDLADFVLSKIDFDDGEELKISIEEAIQLIINEKR